MLKSLMEKLTEIQNMKEDREVTTHIGKYGTEYQGDDDEDEDGEPKKKAAPAGEKRGRGRPRKDADNTGHVAKHEVDKKMPAWLKGGDAPKGKPDKKAVKKHSLKDWFEHMDAKMLAEAEAEKSPFKKPNNPNRTPMDSARALAQKGMAAAKAKPSEKIAEVEVDEAFPDASGAETLSYAEYKKRMEKLSDRQLKYDQARHEREYGPDTGERGPLSPANLPRHFRLQAKILRDKAKAKAKMKPGEKIAEVQMTGGSTQPQKYTTAPSKPGGMDIKDQQGKVVATANNAQAAKAFTDGGIRMTTPDDIQEEGGGVDKKAAFRAKMKQRAARKQSMAEADIPSASADFGAGLGAGRSQRALEEAKNQENKKKCPPMSHIKKMCQDGKTVAEICKMHPDCNQKELKQMVADCKNKLEEGAKPDFLDLDKDGNKKEPMKKAAADKGSDKKDGKKGMSAAQEKFFGKKKTVKEGAEHNHQAAHSEGKAHGLRGHSHCGNNYEDMEEARCYHEGFKEGLDEKHGHQYLDEEEIPMVAGPGNMFDEEEMYEEDNPFFMADPRTPIGGLQDKFSSPVDEMMNTIAFESLDRQLNALLDEGMTVSISKGQQGSPDSVSVTASDADSDKLLALVKQAGLGLFGGDEATMHPGATGSNMPSQSAPGSDIAVVDDHDDMMSLIKKVTDGHDDHGHEAGEETCESCGGMMEEGHSCREAVDEEETEDQMTDEVAEETNPSDNDEPAEEETDATRDAALATAAGKNFADTDSPLEEGGDGGEASDAGAEGVDIADVADETEEDLEESLANGADDTFESDIDFMTKVISGGLNGQKSTGQSTIPVVASQESRLGNPMRESTDLLKDWKKLAGM